MPLIRKDPAAPAAPTQGDDPRTTLALGTAEQRWAAARALAGSADGLSALGQALATETDPRVREAMLTGLARAASPEAVAALLPYLRAEDAQLRTGALDALRAMPTAIAPHLAALLDDADADVRLLACEIARGLSSQAATPLLCDLLDRETEPNVCAAAVEVLAEVGGATALPALARCAARFAGSPFLIFAIRAATARIGPAPSGGPARE
jgi:HEAT repeat protein